MTGDPQGYLSVAMLLTATLSVKDTCHNQPEVFPHHDERSYNWRVRTIAIKKRKIEIMESCKQRTDRKIIDMKLGRNLALKTPSRPKPLLVEEKTITKPCAPNNVLHSTHYAVKSNT
jgi:hypothetical protein